MEHLYHISVRTADGVADTLEAYKGQVLLIVNTASKCGFTKQFKGLQELYEQYKNQGFTILAFPSDNFNHQEFETMEETVSFCQRNYGVTFPVYEKMDVRGKTIHPLFEYLTGQCKGLLTESVKWNFTKFLITREGEVVERFAPQTAPEKIASAIEKLIQ